MELNIGYSAKYPYYTSCIASYPSKLCKFPGIDAALVLKLIEPLKLHLNWLKLDNETYEEKSSLLEAGNLSFIGNLYRMGTINQSFLPIFEEGYVLLIEEPIDCAPEHYSVFQSLDVTSRFAVLIGYLIFVILTEISKKFEAYRPHASFAFVLFYAHFMELYSNLLGIRLYQPCQRLNLPIRTISDLSECLHIEKCKFITSDEALGETGLKKYSSKEKQLLSMVNDTIKTESLLYSLNKLKNLQTVIYEKGFEVFKAYNVSQASKIFQKTKSNGYIPVILDYESQFYAYEKATFGFPMTKLNFPEFSRSFYGIFLSPRINRTTAQLIRSFAGSLDTERLFWQEYSKLRNKERCSHSSYLDFTSSYDEKRWRTFKQLLLTDRAKPLMVQQLYESFCLLLIGYWAAILIVFVEKLLLLRQPLWLILDIDRRSYTF